MNTLASKRFKKRTPSSVSLFEYIVAKLVGIGEIPPKSIKEYNEELEQYNMTRYMKTLYFLCLASCCVIKDQKLFTPQIRSPKRLPGSKKRLTDSLYEQSLFRFFNFTTFPNGPVEQDIYNSMLKSDAAVRWFTLDRVMKMKESVSKGNKSDEVPIFDGIKQYEDEFTETVILVKKSLKYLFSGEYTPYSQKQETGSDLIKYKEIDTQMLIDVSHSFPTWRAQKDEDNRLKDLKGAEAIFAFIKANRLEKNMSKHLEERANLMAEIKAFEEFRRG